ncbi:MAG: hypothetical protein JXQ75_07750 [Phycisphaerae bacterium]|nr:hypothetical protein [Phycisphaerae bacterium]
MPNRKNDDMKLVNVPSVGEARRAFDNAVTLGPPGPVPYFDWSFSRNHLARLLGDRVHREWPKGTIPVYNLPPEWSFEVALQLGIGCVTPGFMWELGRVYRDRPGGNPVYVGGSIRCREDVRRDRRPPLEPILARLEEFITLGRKHDVAVAFTVRAPISIAQLGMGLEHFCIAMADNPDLIKAVIDASVELHVPLIEAAIDAGIDYLIVTENLCFASGPIVHPDLTRRLLHDAVRPYLQPAHARGVAVGLHSDGDNRAFINDFIDLGFCFLNPIEPCGGAFDIYELQRSTRGRLALWGNIDLAGVLSRGTPDDVRRDVREHILRLGPAGGYVCGSSHEISDSVPPENFEALVQAVHDYASVWVPPTTAPAPRAGITGAPGP